MEKRSEENNASIPATADDYEVIVVGGGLAGVCAAVSASKPGARTLLIEKAPYAGGIATASLEPSICNYFKNKSGEFVLQGAPYELVERLADKGAASPKWDQHRGHVIFDVELGKLAMDEMLEDAGVDILYDSLVVGADVDENRITHVKVANRSGLQAYRGRCYVDATGDDDVANYAGVPLRMNGNPHSILFRLGNVDIDRFVDYMREHPEEHFSDSDIGLGYEEALRMYDETGRYQWHHFAAKKMRLVQDPIERGEYSEKWGRFYHMDAFQVHAIRQNGTLVVNTGFFDLRGPEGPAISDLLREGRKLAEHVADFARRTFPGCEESFILATADAPGLRRTRWLDADYTMTWEEYESAPSYPDAVGRGVVMSQRPMHPTNKTFDIPLRCLLPPTIENLVIGSGRGASCEPAELLRVMSVTMAVGQGAGVAAATAAGGNGMIGEVDIESVQTELRKQGVELQAERGNRC
ncbi:MAG: FAD-dependent oxidoreductase [Planctomycetes bacterium]|nr:FAD-dependent oxidoreductase [Planctomycetota bacterium]